MELIIKERGTGKTTELLYASEVTKYPIVVPTAVAAKSLKEAANRLGVTIPEPLTVSELREREMARPKCVLVDDAYAIIGDAMDNYLGCHVLAAALTNGHE